MAVRRTKDDIPIPRRRSAPGTALGQTSETLTLAMLQRSAGNRAVEALVREARIAARGGPSASAAVLPLVLPATSSRAHPAHGALTLQRLVGGNLREGDRVRIVNRRRTDYLSVGQVVRLTQARDEYVVEVDSVEKLYYFDELDEVQGNGKSEPSERRITPPPQEKRKAAAAFEAPARSKEPEQKRQRTDPAPQEREEALTPKAPPPGSLSGLGVTAQIQIKKFLNEKNMASSPFYIMIKSVKFPGWHLTVPVNTAQMPTTTAAMNYVFYSYHVTDENGNKGERAHYFYRYDHEQDNFDEAYTGANWRTADAVVRELFKVEPKPKHNELVMFRLGLIGQKEFTFLGEFTTFMTRGAKTLGMTELALYERLRSSSAQETWQQLQHLVANSDMAQRFATKAGFKVGVA